ncbi:MAG: hypothetical protein ACM3U2_07760 [Deltaproteobacteria bacterium]
MLHAMKETLMNARLVAVGGILGLVLAVAMLAPQTAAQVEGGKGIFRDFKVGQMVEVRNDPRVGLIITFYDDPAEKAKMAYKIVEIDRDYIALDYHDPASEVQLEMRYPVNAIAGVCHMKKSGTRPAPAGTKKKKPAID